MVSRRAPSPENVAPPLSSPVPCGSGVFETPPVSGGDPNNLLAPYSSLPAPPACNGRLSIAFTRCRLRRVQILRDHKSPSFSSCDGCMGLYSAARGGAEEET